MKRIFKKGYSDANGNFVLEDEITVTETLKFKKTHPDAKIPSYAYDGESVGLDLTCVGYEYKEDIDCFCYDTGLAIELDDDDAAFVVPNSRNRKTDYYMPNTPGIVDPGFRGPITCNYKSRCPRYVTKFLHCLEDLFNKFNLYTYEDKIHEIDKRMNAPYKVGDVIGQLIIVKVQRKIPVEAEELTPSKRMSNSHGSTENK